MIRQWWKAHCLAGKRALDVVHHAPGDKPPVRQHVVARRLLAWQGAEHRLIGLEQQAVRSVQNEARRRLLEEGAKTLFGHAQGFLGARAHNGRGQHVGDGLQKVDVVGAEAPGCVVWTLKVPYGCSCARTMTLMPLIAPCSRNMASAWKRRSVRKSSTITGTPVARV